MYYECQFFRLEELVPKNVFEELGNSAWGLFDTRMLYTLDCVRDVLGVPLIVNDWLWSGNHQYRGFRPEGWKPSKYSIGGKYSKHKHGGAFDAVSAKMTAEEMRLKILEHNKVLPYLTRIENKVNWLHLDNKNINKQKLYLFNP